MDVHWYSIKFLFILSCIFYQFINLMGHNYHQSQFISESSSVLWSLAPCQSVFWVPNASTVFNQNWISYRYEGDTILKYDDCVFILESDPSTKIEIIIRRIHLFSNNQTHSPCLILYSVDLNGTIRLMKKECNTILIFDEIESYSTFTESNTIIIITTIRYGNFHLTARAVPRNIVPSETVLLNVTTPNPIAAGTSNTELITSTASEVNDLLSFSINNTFHDLVESSPISMILNSSNKLLND